MSKHAQPWSYPVSLNEIPETGRHFDLAPDAKTRAALAALAGVPEMKNLRASFDVAPHGRDGLHLRGSVAATVVQTCVVTLDPIEREAEEAIDITFAQSSSHRAGEATSAEPEALGDPDGPEPLTDGTVDLGAIASEYLVLGIDPYPRKPGVEFQPPSEAEDPSQHPFAALSALKAGPGDGSQ
jgi:uncharacterized metal-binding protein YceD (DUF177 family)